MHLQHTHLTLYEQNWVLITDQMTSSLCMMLYQAHATVGEEGQVGMLSEGSVADAGLDWQVNSGGERCDWLILIGYVVRTAGGLRDTRARVNAQAIA